jgi:hypothetical protein
MVYPPRHQEKRAKQKNIKMDGGKWLKRQAKTIVKRLDKFFLKRLSPSKFGRNK